MKADKVINIHNLLSNWIKFLLSLIKLNLYLQDTFHLQDYRLHGFTNNKRIQEFQDRFISVLWYVHEASSSRSIIRKADYRRSQVYRPNISTINHFIALYLTQYNNSPPLKSINNIFLCSCKNNETVTLPRCKIWISRNIVSY